MLVKPVELDTTVCGDCNFEKPLAACGYSQGRDDDLDWEQANTREKPSSDPWMPSGGWLSPVLRLCMSARALPSVFPLPSQLEKPPAELPLSFVLLPTALFCVGQ
ncbi:hypothetical protein PAMP_005168 [Pampus punctatissimus]